MFRLLETAIAFASVMLAGSLIVSALVHIVSNVGRFRSRTVMELLRTLLRSFHEAHGQAAVPASCEIAFAESVLADPVLRADGERAESSVLARRIEFVDADDLAAIIYKLSAKAKPAGTPPGAAQPPTNLQEVIDAPGVALPEKWSPEVERAEETAGTAPAGQSPTTVGPTDYATTTNFAAHIKRWFATVEGTSAQQFKRQMRRLSLVVSMVVVILLNIDAFHLVSSLYHDTTAAQRVSSSAVALQDAAARLDDSKPKPPKELALEMQNVASILEDADIGLGWEKSWITARWCAYHQTCGDRNAARPTLTELVRDMAFWFGGLFFSLVLLSLGAPFWVTTLARLINLRNEVQARKAPKPNDADGDAA